MKLSRRSFIFLATTVALPMAGAFAAPGIEGVTWVIDGAHQAGRPVPTIQLTAGRLTGSDGCNNIVGTYQRRGSAGLVIPGEGLAKTKMACDNMAEADAFTTALGQVRSFRIRGKSLRLLNAKGRTIARFTAIKK